MESLIQNKDANVSLQKLKEVRSEVKILLIRKTMEGIQCLYFSFHSFIQKSYLGMRRGFGIRDSGPVWERIYGNGPSHVIYLI